MTVITRHDQLTFVLDVYREVVTVPKRAQLSRMLHDFQSLYGPYAQCYARNAQQHEIVLAKHGGQLLAETIRHYFHANHNLIFCEWSQEQTAVIVIVIKEGIVCLDRTLPPASLSEELLPFRLCGLSFQLVVASEGLNQNSPPDWVLAFTPLCTNQEFLSHSVIAHLPRLEHATLLPIKQLIKTLAWRAHLRLAIGAAVIAALMMGIGLFTYREQLRQHTPTPNSVNQTVPWLAYQEAMTSHPNASTLLLTSVHYLEALRTLPGWNLLSLRVDRTELVAELQQQAGSLAALQQLAQALQAQLRWTADGVQLVRPVNPTAAASLPSLNAMPFTQTALQRAILRHTLDSNLQVMGTRSLNDCQVTRLTLTLHDFYLSELLSLAHVLQSQPVIIEQFLISAHEWQLHANIKLSVWGSS